MKNIQSTHYPFMFKKLNSKPSFTLAEILITTAIFALSTYILTYSVFNGLKCNQQIYIKDNHPDKILSFVTQIITKTNNIADLEKINTLTLPTKEKIKVNFNIRPTNIEHLYQIIITINDKNFTDIYTIKY